MTEDLQACIRECLECYQVCTETILYCMQMGGRHAEPGHLTLLMDCADICRTSANFMLRSSDLHGWVCGVCAEVCKECGHDCEKFSDDEKMQRCADASFECMESCRQMAGMAAHHA